MDPDEALRILRLTAKQMDADENPLIFAAHANELIEHFTALDEWLSKGGFLPAAWAQPGRSE